MNKTCRLGIRFLTFVCVFAIFLFNEVYANRMLCPYCSSENIIIKSEDYGICFCDDCSNYFKVIDGIVYINTGESFDLKDIVVGETRVVEEYNNGKTNTKNNESDLSETEDDEDIGQNEETITDLDLDEDIATNSDLESYTDESEDEPEDEPEEDGANGDTLESELDETIKLEKDAMGESTIRDGDIIDKKDLTVATSGVVKKGSASDISPKGKTDTGNALLVIVVILAIAGLAISHTGIFSQRIIINKGKNDKKNTKK